MSDKRGPGGGFGVGNTGIYNSQTTKVRHDLMED